MSQLVQQGRLRQEGKLNPHMSQSIAILQMNSEELLEYLNKIRQENPLIEHDDIPNLQKEYMLLRQRASWIDAGPSPISSAAAFERGAPDKETESLSAFLRDQLARKRLPQRLLAMCGYLADLLDDNGWLSQEDLDELEALNVPRDMIDRALAQLQALEPAGVGARSLSECLILQMEWLDAVPVGAKDFARHWLEALGKGHYRRIARETGLSLEQTHAAGQFLSTLLWPLTPAGPFSPRGPPRTFALTCLSSRKPGSSK